MFEEREPESKAIFGVERCDDEGTNSVDGGTFEEKVANWDETMPPESEFVQWRLWLRLFSDYPDSFI